MKVKSDDVWPPGFRFHPTDEELVVFHLKRKICGRKIKFNIIAETDVYKWDPEELPGQSLLKTGDRQWFFFSPRDRKYPNGARSNRATRNGYWKATGKDRTVTCSSRNVGVKKTLVFYRGRAPNGQRTDWVMHEYTLDEEELKRCQNVHDYYALYKVFKKSGPGPKNGEQYGAPFKEEDWADDECLDVTNPVDQETPAKQLNEVASIDDGKANGQVPSILDGIDEFFKELADDPLPHEPQMSHAYEVPQVVEEENQSTLVNSSSREVHFDNPISVCNEQASFEFTRAPSSNLQLYEASEVTSAPKNCEQVLELCEEDFLEMDDLIGPEPTMSTIEKPVENLQFDEFEGLSELDLFHDAAMFLHDMGPFNQETIPIAVGNNMVNLVGYQSQHHSVVNQVDHQLQPNSLVSQVHYQLQPHSLGVEQSSSQPWMGDHLSNVFVPAESNQQILWPPTSGGEHISSQSWIHDQLSDVFTPTEPNQGILPPSTSGMVQESTNLPADANQNQRDQEGGGVTATSWISSSLWAFVESIPTTPASASESPLNRAFERMSSFSRVRLNARNTITNVAGGDGNGAVTRRPTGTSSNRGFLFLSILGALCAILWVLMGTVKVLGRCIFS